MLASYKKHYHETTINDPKRELHRQNVQEEINRQNDYEKKWKLKTNINKFQIIPIGLKKTLPININGEIIQYNNSGKLLGLNFTSNNFFKKQNDENIRKAKAALRRLWRFRTLKKTLKLRLYKTLILPIILYPVIPLNTCSDHQIERLQKIQNRAVRWICNERWPIICPLIQRHEELKLEFINERIKRMAEGIWSKIHDENSAFHQNTIDIQMIMPHKSYPSSYDKTYE